MATSSQLVLFLCLFAAEVIADPTVAVTVEGTPTDKTATLSAVGSDNTKDFKAGSASAVQGGTWDVTPSDGQAHTKFTIEGSDLKPSTEYTVALSGLEAGTLALPGAYVKSEGTVCTVAAPLGLTMGPVSGTDKSIKVTWTEAAGTNNPTEYNLLIGAETIGTVKQGDPAEFIFTKADAAGTLLEVDTDYKCKITATIAATTNCAKEDLEDTIDCKIDSSKASADSNNAKTKSNLNIAMTFFILASVQLCI